MTIGIILDYEIKKRIQLISSHIKMNKSCLINTFESIVSNYIKTEAGKCFYKKNNERITVHDFLEEFANIPNDILEDYLITHDPCNEFTEHVIELPAFLVLIESKQVDAIFGIYNQDFHIAKYDLNKLINSVHWENEHAFRVLCYKGRLVGFGFVSIDLIDETEFTFDDFIMHVSKLADEANVIDGEIYKYKEVRFKMIKLDN
jgi:hypothetical protein